MQEVAFPPVVVLSPPSLKILSIAAVRQSGSMLLLPTHMFKNNTFTTQKPGIVVYGGTLPASTTWTKDYPYLVTGTVTVAAGATLTIEPGAIVKFARYTSIQVNGTLIADGNDSSANGFTPIIFTSINDHSVGGSTGSGSPKPGDSGFSLLLNDQQ